MFECLFAITIAYEAVQMGVSLYKTKKDAWSEVERQLIPDPKRRAANTITSLVGSMLVIAGALFAIFAGGSLAVKIAAVYAIFCAIGAAMYLYVWAQGRFLSLIYALYNCVMLPLFIWAVCTA